MPTHIFEPFSPEELAQATLAEPFPFTKGAKLLKIPVVERSPMYNVYGPGAMIERDTRLYDLVADPDRRHRSRIPRREARMERLMVELMKVNHAPSEAFARLGIDLASEASWKRQPRRRLSRRRSLWRATSANLHPSVASCSTTGQEGGVRALAFSTGGGTRFLGPCRPVTRHRPSLVSRRPRSRGSHPLDSEAPILHDAERDRRTWASIGAFPDSSSPVASITSGNPPSGHPLHGRFPFTPARLTAYGEDWDRPVTGCSIAKVRSSSPRHGGEAIRLRRRIEAGIGCEHSRDF